MSLLDLGSQMFTLPDDDFENPSRIWLYFAGFRTDHELAVIRTFFWIHSNKATYYYAGRTPGQAAAEVSSFIRLNPRKRHRYAVTEGPGLFESDHAYSSYIHDVMCLHLHSGEGADRHFEIAKVPRVATPGFWVKFSDCVAERGVTIHY